MKKISTLLIAFLPFVVFGQIKIIETATSTASLEGQTVTVSGNLASTEFADFFNVVNTGNSSLELKVRRTEVDVMAGTDNATCWKVCPAQIPAGSEVVQVSQFSEIIAAGDTNTTFSAHHYLNGIDGCSLFKYEWVDAATLSTVYGTVFIKFDHSSTGCAADLSVTTEFSAFTKVYPNPTTSSTFILIEGVSGEVNYEISNLLGQRAFTGYSNVQNKGVLEFDASSLKDGVYFVVIKINDKTLKTEKLVVKH